MQRSESIASLTKALAAARTQIGSIVKDKQATIVGKNKDGGTSKYSYNYADLGSVIDAYTAPLSANGLVLLQPVGGPRDGHLILTTMLAHESGEWIAEEYPVAMFQRAQDQGSAITYARRYAAQAFLGLASEDDDGEAASKAEPAPRQTARSNGHEAATKPAPAPVPDPLDQERRGLLVDLARSAKLISGSDAAPFLALCAQQLGRPIANTKEIRASEFDKVKGALELAAGISSDVDEVMTA
jgi:hypothetical protein